MNGRNAGPVEVFEVSGDAAMAWYYVMAHWPNPETAPELRFGPGPLHLVFDARPEALYALRCTLKNARGFGGHLAESASGVLMALHKQLPEAPPPASGPTSQAG
jgi:hypothetical protein